MKRGIAAAALVAVALVALVAVQVAGATRSRHAEHGSKPTSCKLAHGVKHVVYLQFDNTHFNRDNPSVASDLEKMPHLLSFLKQNGTLFTNDHTILISHTAGGILSSLTGLYPDRNGQTVSNSYDYFDAAKNPHFTGSFKYWTNPVDPTNDPLPNMITDGQKTTPAPWVPFTRAGCDVGGVGTANIELENNSTAPTGDITQVFGQGSPEWNETAANPQQGQTDFVGIAIHCSQKPSSTCAGNPNAKPDLLPDEPGGYSGFAALYGAKYVDPAITNGKACVKDTNGNAVTDPDGYCGFPGFDGMFAQNTLGYVAAMQENGVPVTYGYISDVHDLHAPIASSDSYSSSATGPGELGHLQQLKAYDMAFEHFFHNLEQHGINRHNTLFVVTVDEGDHFAGGVGTPQSGQDWLLYNHTNCTNLSQCPTNQIGEVGANIKSLLTSEDPSVTTGFDIHFDDAPTFYVNGQPGPTDATVRQLEHDVGNLTSVDPYVRDSGGNPQTVPLTVALADPVEEQALHMVNADPNRTPTFTMFGNPDFFFQTSNPCTGVAECVNSGFAWNHGDIQQEIGNTWVGMVGPGIEHRGSGIDSTTWTDHTNLRPTILSLVGLKDDYTDDGHVLVQALEHHSLPHGLSGGKIAGLENAYEQLNAPFGAYSADTLQASTFGVEGSDGDYGTFMSDMATLEPQREALATTIRGRVVRRRVQRRLDQRRTGHDLDQPGERPDRPGGRAPALASAPTSEGSSSRHPPGSSPSSVRPAYPDRCSAVTGWPTAASIRLTWCLRPSWRTSSTRPKPRRRARAGAVRPSSSSTPSRSRCSASSPGSPSTSATYVFSTPYRGWASRWASCPSFVSRSAPVVSASSRPTGTTRGSCGTSSTTVGRPCGSLAVVTTPAGLCRRT